MAPDELIIYIVRHFDSRYLVPLSEQYAADAWNAAMRRAIQYRATVATGNETRRSHAHQNL